MTKTDVDLDEVCDRISALVKKGPGKNPSAESEVNELLRPVEAYSLGPYDYLNEKIGDVKYYASEYFGSSSDKRNWRLTKENLNSSIGKLRYISHPNIP